MEKHSLRPTAGARRGPQSIMGSPQDERDQEMLVLNGTLDRTALEVDVALRHEGKDKFRREQISYGKIGASEGEPSGASGASGASVLETSGSLVDRPNEDLDVSGSLDWAQDHRTCTQLAKMHTNINIFSPAKEFSPATNAVVLFLRFNILLCMFLFATIVFAIPALQIYYQSNPLAIKLPSGSKCFATDRNHTAPLGFINAMTLPVYQGAPNIVVVCMQLVVGIAFIVFYVAVGSHFTNGSAPENLKESIADYSVFVSRLPEDVSPRNIANKFNEPFESNDPRARVVSVVCLSKDLAQMKAVTKKQKAVWDRNKHYKLYGHMRKSCRYRCFMGLFHCCTTSKSVRDELETIEQKIRQLHDRGVAPIYTGDAFVTFKTKADVHKCLHDFNSTKLDQCWAYTCTTPALSDNASIVVSHAFEPEAVIYQNFGHGMWANTFRRLIVTPLLSAMILLVTLAAVLAIKLNPYVNDQQLSTTIIYIVKLVGYLENGGLSIVIVILGELIEKVLSVLVKLERYPSKGQLQSVRLSRIFAVQCLNNIAVLFLVTIIALIYEPFTSLDQIIHPVVLDNYTHLTSYDFVSKSGITVVVVSLSSAILPNVYQGFWFFSNFLKRRLGMAKALTQLEMDKAHEGRSFNLTDHYSYLLIMLFQVFVYWTLIPIVSVIAFVGVTLRYFIIKYNLMYHHPKPKGLDPQVLKHMVRKILKFGFISHVFASLMWFWFNSVSGKYFANEVNSFDDLFDCTDYWILIPLVMAACGLGWLLWSLPPISTIRYFQRQKKLSRNAISNPGSYDRTKGIYICEQDIERNFHVAQHHSLNAVIVRSKHLYESNELLEMPGSPKRPLSSPESESESNHKLTYGNSPRGERRPSTVPIPQSSGSSEVDKTEAAIETLDGQNTEYTTALSNQSEIFDPKKIPFRPAMDEFLANKNLVYIEPSLKLDVFEMYCRLLRTDDKQKVKQVIITTIEQNEELFLRQGFYQNRKELATAVRRIALNKPHSGGADTHQAFAVSCCF